MPHPQLLTATDARAHYCPYSMGTFLRHCEGESCMAWRLALDQRGDVVQRSVAQPWVCHVCNGTGVVPNPDGPPATFACAACEGEGRGEFTWTTLGFCGLVGDPRACSHDDDERGK